MKLNIEELGLIGISFTDMLGFYEEDEINSIVEEINEEGSYYDDWMDFNKNDDGDVDCTLMTGSFEIIDHINNMKICETDPFVMIVKDAWDGESGCFRTWDRVGGDVSLASRVDEVKGIVSKIRVSDGVMTKTEQVPMERVSFIFIACTY